MTPPYYIIPAIEALPSASGEERVALIRRIATAIGDPVALRAIIGIDPEEFTHFYPDPQTAVRSTEDTIDTFISEYGNPANAKATEIEDIITPAVPYDISAIESMPEIGDSDLGIDIPATPEKINTIKPVPKPTPVDKPSVARAVSDAHDNSTATSAHDTNLSESLAKIMIKSGNYQKALEIITEISLNNPKKSIYFADQMRFLKKLIAYTSKDN